MIETEWKIAKSNQFCILCNGKFDVGQTYFSALFEEGNGFQRHDYCTKCFQEQRPASVFSFWKTEVPEDDPATPPKVVLNADSVLDFFRRLAVDSTPQRVAFRYVLALMLTRKKFLKLDGSERAKDGSEILTFAERRGGEKHTVIPVDLNENEITAVSEELGRLLGISPAPSETGPVEEAKKS